MATAGVVNRGGQLHHVRLPRPPLAANYLANGRRPVCKFWLQGRCTRRPCPFRHSRDPSPPLVRQPPMQQKQSQRSPHGSLVWRNPNVAPASAACGPERLPPPTPPPQVDTGENHSITFGEEPVELKPPMTSPPRDDAGDGKIPLSEDCVECPPPLMAPRQNDAGGEGSCASVGEASTSFSLRTVLGEGGGSHRQAITGIVLPSGSDKIFSGSSDGTVRVWDCGSGRCLQVIELGGPIACVITDGHWVFAGGRGGVNGCNTLTGAGHALPGTAGQVYSLATSKDVVFAGTDDGSILAWKATLDAAAEGDGLYFHPATALRGHTSAVLTLVVGCGCTRLFSGSADRTIRAWDTHTLQCCYTVSAHDDVVTSVLCWSEYLLSCSLDGTAKVWAAAPMESETNGDSGGLEVVYTLHEDDGVLLLNGVHDTEGMPVVMCSLADNTVRLYDLPSFRDRGRIASKGRVQAMHTGPDGFFFTGDAAGEISVWKWSGK